MLFREKKYNNLKELIEEIQIDELNDKRKPSYLKLKADWYHYKENYNEAFKTYKIMNEIIRESSVVGKKLKGRKNVVGRSIKQPYINCEVCTNKYSKACFARFWKNKTWKI